MKFAFYTLGCKVNQYETQAMEQLLLEAGHTLGDFSEDCQGYIINTCSVTAVADKKNRAIIRRCRREHPGAILAVCGCHSQHDPQAIAALGADLIGGSGQRRDFIQKLLSLSREKAAPTETITDNALRRRSYETLPAGGLSGRTRAMLKVQDGCVNFCTYCIIPYTRGPVRSETLENALSQAKTLSHQGYREIVITGIEIASWGVDLPGKPSLIDLVEQLCTSLPDLRIRLGSLEPRIVTESFCRRLKKHQNLCPHFHLSLQSGSDAVLARMKRKYDTSRYYESVQLLKTHFPGCAITTDLIVAFPGETEAEFAESLAFIEKCRFADMHIFPYSRRPGTPANNMPGQHTNHTKESRSHAAIAVAARMSQDYRKEMIGTTLAVLFEEPEGEYFVGHAPNYVKVYTKGQGLHNQVLDVTVTGLYADGVLVCL